MSHIHELGCMQELCHIDTLAPGNQGIPSIRCAANRSTRHFSGVLGGLLDSLAPRYPRHIGTREPVTCIPLRCFRCRQENDSLTPWHQGALSSLNQPARRCRVTRTPASEASRQKLNHGATGSMSQGAQCCRGSVSPGVGGYVRAVRSTCTIVK